MIKTIQLHVLPGGYIIDTLRPTTDLLVWLSLQRILSLVHKVYAPLAFFVWLSSLHAYVNPSNAEAILFSKVQGHESLWKSSKPCDVGIHWKALAEYSQMSTHLPGFRSFFRFLHLFVLTKLVASSIRVNPWMLTAAKSILVTLVKSFDHKQLIYKKTWRRRRSFRSSCHCHLSCHSCTSYFLIFLW